MTTTQHDATFKLPRDADLGLHRLTSASGLSISLLPNGALYAIEHEPPGSPHGKTMINLVLGSPIDGGIGRVCMRAGSDAWEIVGRRSDARFAATEAGCVWEGERGGVAYRCTLWLHPHDPCWLWRVEAINRGTHELACDAALLQDVGLGGRGFLMNNEAYASQYIDHHVAGHDEFGHVLMCRQNLAQAGGMHPWVMHGCVPRAASFATDGLQVFGPGFRATDDIADAELPSERLQHELAMPTLRSQAQTLAPGASASWTFFAIYEPDHPAPSSDDDLVRVELVREAVRAMPTIEAETRPVPRNHLRSSRTLACDTGDRMSEQTTWRHVERDPVSGELLSAFAGDADKGHLVTGEKDLRVARRHGHLVRTGAGLLLDEATLCSTAWMHGVFAAQVTVGNTSLHKLFSVSRDPYNVMRSSGLRILVRRPGKERWSLLASPTLFTMTPGACYWLYAGCAPDVAVECVASPDEPALRFHVGSLGDPMEMLVVAHVVLGEREYDHSGVVELDAARKRIAFRPEPAWLFGQKYPHASYHLVTSTPDAVDAVGGDELLHEDGIRRGYGYVALRTRPTTSLDFAIVGDLHDPSRAAALADKHAGHVDERGIKARTTDFWRGFSRGTSIVSPAARFEAVADTLPWYAHNALVHLTVPHGLEQYTGAAWGTRDVCQGPVEYLLAVGHHAPVKDILRNVFAQQYLESGDWPQWYMHEPYAPIQDRHSHGDVIVWPLKALCDYLEATDDLAFLDEEVPYRHMESAEPAKERATVAAHVDKLIDAVRSRFIPGTSLIRYGVGDWNDALQPADASLRDTMVSTWTVAILWQQLTRYAAVMDRHRHGRFSGRELPDLIKSDFLAHLMPDGIVPGYTIFDPGTARPRDYLLHPRDARTGLRHSLLPMTRSTIAGLFTREQAHAHLALIREHLLFPDGVRLMDRPPEYRGGIETIFKRAESAAYFGREIGLQYIHAHLRYGEALARLGEAEALYEALLVANPIAVTDLLRHAGLRQRNAYFSSSDAAFADRYDAATDWHRVRDGTITVDGGWRIYSSGPGLYVNLVVRHLLGIRRHFDAIDFDPVLPRTLDGVVLDAMLDDQRVRYTFHVGPRGYAPQRVVVNRTPVEGTRAPNPYRDGALRVPLAAFKAALTEDLNDVHVHL